MAPNLQIGSYEVGGGLYHSLLIFDLNMNGDDDFETNTEDVLILRGGAGSNHGYPLELSVIVELQD